MTFISERDLERILNENRAIEAGNARTNQMLHKAGHDPIPVGPRDYMREGENGLLRYLLLLLTRRREETVNAQEEFTHQAT